MKRITKIKAKIIGIARNIQAHPKTRQTIEFLKLKRYDKRKRIIVWSTSGGFLLLLIIVLTVSISNTRSSSSSSKEAVSTRMSIQEQTIGQLNRIEAQIKALKTQNPATSDLSATKIATIQNQLVQLSQSIGGLATQKDAQKTQAVVVLTGHDVTNHIDSVQNLLKQIKRQITPPHYLPAKALPFRVVSVRGINGVLNAIIQSKGEYIPIVKNDSYGQWRLIQISYDPQEAVFKNTAKQMVKVQISR